MAKTTQKIINIGSSKGITIPAKELNRLNLTTGDSVDITIRPSKDSGANSDAKILASAKQTLQEYKQDFDNLEQR